VPTFRSEIANMETPPSCTTSAVPPGSSKERLPPPAAKSTRSVRSSGRDGTRVGRIPISIERSAIRADRLADRVAPKVAIASTSVPLAVPSSAIVVISAKA
jgi:hypothetical protein